MNNLALIPVPFCRLKGHRIVLAAKMKTVETAFENLLELQTAMDANTLKMVIEYCYSNEVRVSAYEQVFQLLKAAQQYEIVTLRGQCEEFLNASIGIKTAAKFLNLSNENGFVELASRCLSIVCEDFENVVNEPYFNDLSVQDFKQILKSDKLCARNEIFIFTAFLKWLLKASHMDLEQMYREEHTMPVSDGISDILSDIKFPLMDEAVSILSLFLYSGPNPTNNFIISNGITNFSFLMHMRRRFANIKIASTWWSNLINSGCVRWCVPAWQKKWKINECNRDDLQRKWSYSVRTIQ